MKKLLFLSIVVVLLSSCGKGIEHQAKSAMKKSLKATAYDPKSVKFSNEKVMFSNDSLCIIHADIKGKNAFGAEVTNKMEYIFLKSNGVSYENIHQSDDGDVFITEENYDRKKEKEIYRELDYPRGLYYLSSLVINSAGRIVGSEDTHQTINIPSLTGTGDWKIGSFVDDFGNATGSTYLYLAGIGQFSNSATTNSKLLANLCVTKDNFFLKLYEYGNLLVKGDGLVTLKIRDSRGIIYTWTMFNRSNGMIESFHDEYNETLRRILTQGGELMFSATIGNYTTSTYTFIVNTNGFNKAIEFVQ